MADSLNFGVEMLNFNYLEFFFYFALGADSLNLGADLLNLGADLLNWLRCVRGRFVKFRGRFVKFVSALKMSKSAPNI